VVRGGTYRFLLRLPEELRRRLPDAASHADRSLDHEIIDRLERSFEAPRGERGR
jgi:hypothetical protein